MTVRALCLMTALVAAAPVPAHASVAEQTVIADGHVDLGPRFVNGAWTVQLRDDTAQPVVWRDVSQVVLHAVDTAAVTVPADPAFAFLGAAGTRVWVLPQTQRPGILWPGWNTQDPSVIAKVNREATWTLHGSSGPGRFTLFLNGNFGEPVIVFDSTKRYPQETGIEAASHVHGNWAFTAPGTYLLDVEMAATTADGGPVSDRQTLRIFVGPGDPSAAFDAAPPTSSSTAATSTTTATTTAASTRPAAGAGQTPTPGQTPWTALGAGALAVVAVGAGVLLWLRRTRSRRREAL